MRTVAFGLSLYGITAAAGAGPALVDAVGDPSGLGLDTALLGGRGGQSGAEGKGG